MADVIKTDVKQDSPLVDNKPADNKPSPNPDTAKPDYSKAADQGKEGAKPGDQKNVEFVGPDPSKPPAKLKLGNPTKSPVTDSADAQEAEDAVPAHVSPVNLTPERPGVGEATYSGGIPTVLNCKVPTDEPGPPVDSAHTYIVNERGDTLPAQSVAGSNMPLPAALQPPPPQTVVVQK